MQSYHTYVLLSEKDNHFYIGMTSCLQKRVYQHNVGKVKSTKARRPFKLFYYEEYQDKTEARKREIFLKSGPGRLFLQRKLKRFTKDEETIKNL
ncbi:MAG: GIY-YIG nuclease family protein [Candidatus Zixiibacteriota bacterium]